jgi:hypothetical protein
VIELYSPWDGLEGEGRKSCVERRGEGEGEEKERSEK